MLCLPGMIIFDMHAFYFFVSFVCLFLFVEPFFVKVTSLALEQYSTAS